MKKILSVAAVILVSFTVSAQASKDTIYSYLYNLLEHKEIYVNEKNAKISQIKNMLALPGINGEQRYDINHRLYNEYKTFISDSAIYYTRQNLEIAKKLDRPLLINESKLDLVSLYVIAGMYIESLDLLKSIGY